MKISSAYETLAQDWEDRAQEMENLRISKETTRVIRRMARSLRRAQMEDEEVLLTLNEAVAYSRGYTEAYLRRTLQNYGTRREPRFRKGDIPRHPVPAEG